MSVIQYVGARYVPKFFDNPTGGSEWVSGVIYEPLTIVTYLNASYTSKKEVPATVGNPASNPEYWVATGNYNAQVESYRQEVIALGTRIDSAEEAVTDVESDVTTLTSSVADAQGDITSLQNDVNSLDTRVTDLENDPAAIDFFKSVLNGKKIVIIGDSLVAADNVNSLGYYLRANYGMNAVEYGVNGAAIAGSSASSVASRIDAVIAENPDADYFMISGGANDKNQNINIGVYQDRPSGTNTFVGALQTIIKKCTTAYPGKMVCGMTTFHRYDTLNSFGYGEMDYVSAMISTCGYMGIPCFDAYDNAGFNLIEGDGYNWADRGMVATGDRDHHISSQGYEVLAAKTAAFLVTSDFNILRDAVVNRFNDTIISGLIVNFASGFKFMLARFTPANKFDITKPWGDFFATDTIQLTLDNTYFSFLTGSVCTIHGARDAFVVSSGYTGVNNLGPIKVVSPTSGSFNGHLSIFAWGY